MTDDLVGRSRIDWRRRWLIKSTGEFAVAFALVFSVANPEAHGSLAVIDGLVCTLNFNALMPIAVDGSTFDFKMRDGPKETDRNQAFKIAAFPGGLAIRDDATGALTSIWWQDGEWCVGDAVTSVQRPKCSRRLKAAFEVKNDAGQTIGVVISQGHGLRIVSARSPFLKTGYELDPDVGTINLTYEDGRTTVTARNSKVDLLGRLTMVGKPAPTSEFGEVIQNKFIFGGRADESCLKAPDSQQRKFHPPPVSEPPAAAPISPNLVR